MKIYQLFLLLLLFSVSCSSKKESDLVAPDCSQSGLALMVDEKTNVSCTASGEVSLSASGGGFPYTYSSNGIDFQESPIFSNLPVGTYTFSVKDALGCLATVSETISSDEGTVSATVATEPAGCTTDDGQITISASGGVSPYTYKLGDGAFQTENVFSELAAGTYQVTIADSDNCSVTIEVTIEVFSTLTASAVSTFSGCGTSNASLTLTATGGEAPFTYQLGTGSFQSENVFNSLAADTYSATVKDALGCETQLEVKVETGISLETDILPIISQNCAKSGCHLNTQNPNLTTKESIIANASAIRSRTTAGTMPPTGPLPASQVELIQCWVEDGAKNN